MKGFDDDDQYWSKSGTSFNLGDEKPAKYKFDNISQYSVRSTKPNQPQVNAPEPTKTLQSNFGSPISILSEDDIECSQLFCFACNKLITEDDPIKYEGEKMFTNDVCWKHWIKKMVDSENFQIRDLRSHAAKRHFLDCISATCNGQLIIKVILIFKGAMGEYEFGSLLYDNTVAFNHYVTFLSETHQNDEKLLRCKNMSDEPMKKLREIMNDNSNVTPASVHQFIRKLIEFRDEIKLNANLTPIHVEMIDEYACLLDWQAENFKELINHPFVETVIATNLSYMAIKDRPINKFLKDNFKVTPEEYFWTCLKKIVEQRNIAELEKALNHKDFGCKPDVSYERILSFLFSLSKEPDEFKMRCLLKISNINDMVDCANLYNGCFEALKGFSSQHKEFKKVYQALTSNKR